jgi:hypothetical protein
VANATTRSPLEQFNEALDPFHDYQNNDFGTESGKEF